MEELRDFGTIILVVAGGFSLALLSSKLTERFPIPAPALFLVAAAIASDLFPALSEQISIRDVERIGTVALIVILFDGGMGVGMRRLREAAWPIVSLGVVGTFGTAAVVAAFGHWALGFDWTTAWLLGAVLAPTDPAVMFSVLGNREVGGRSGTILEGESGANDPVGIALVLGVLELATHDDASAWSIAADFSASMVLGLAVGVLGAITLLPVMRRVSLPSEGLYPIRVLAAAGVVYAAATVVGGSGFLAVFVTGILISEARAPYKGDIKGFHTSLASLAEVVVFVTLGLTIDLGSIFAERQWLDGILVALVLTLVARPLVVGLLLLPARLQLEERLFVAWSGLKGAVPILLGTFVLLAGVTEAERLYGIVFVVVAFSVLVEGSSIPLVARRLGIPMETVAQEPFGVSIRLRADPELRRFVVAAGSAAEGRAIRELPIDEHSWISLVVRRGEARQARGEFRLDADDEVLLLSDAEDVGGLGELFERSRSPR